MNRWKTVTWYIFLCSLANFSGTLQLRYITTVTKQRRYDGCCECTRRRWRGIHLHSRPCIILSKQDNQQCNISYIYNFFGKAQSISSWTIQKKISFTWYTCAGEIFEKKDIPYVLLVNFGGAPWLLIGHCMFLIISPWRLYKCLIKLLPLPNEVTQIWCARVVKSLFYTDLLY